MRIFSSLSVAMLSTLALSGCGQDRAPDPQDVRAGETAADCPTFMPAQTGLPDSGEWRTHPSIADVNGDGLGDLAVLARKGRGPRVFLSDGLGAWTEASAGLEYEGTLNSCGVGTRLVDMNGDGHLDLLVADHCQGVRVYHGDGGTSWTEKSKGIPRNMEGFNDIDAGDLDGDGLLDLVAISSYSRGFLVLRARRGDSWEVWRDSGLPAAGSGFRLLLRDVNVDGRLDVLTNFEPSSETRDGKAPAALIWLQTDSGTFVPATGFDNHARFMGVDTWSSGPGQPLDVFFSLVGAQAGIHLYRSSDGSHWEEAARITEGWFPEMEAHVDIKAADVNGDGCVDLLTTEAGSRKVILAVGNCADEWTPCPDESLPLEIDVAGWGLDVGDINGDGRLDVVAGFGLEANGGLKAWIQTSPGS